MEHLIDELPKLSGNYLEIGIYEGDMVSELADAFPERLIFAVDPFIEDGYTKNQSGRDRGQILETQKDLAMRNMQSKENIRFFEMTSRDFYQNICDDIFCENANVCAVLIDGSHWEDDVSNDVDLAMKLIGKKQGIIYFDDLNLPEVNKVYSKFLDRFQDRIANVDNILTHEDGTVAVVAVHVHCTTT